RLGGGSDCSERFKLLIPKRDCAVELRANDTTEPSDPEYQRHAENGFAYWRLGVSALVTAGSFSLAKLRDLPSRPPIARHDCGEGWSCIVKCKGVRLARLLDLVGAHPETRYVVFYCADAMNLSGDKYYESIDLDGAIHRTAGHGRSPTTCHCGCAVSA